MQIRLHHKTLHIELTAAAAQALAERSVPLLAEMELYFSCLIRKQVRFRDAADDVDAVAVNERLSVRFHPVMSQGCDVAGHRDGPPLTDFPIVDPERFSPGWLRIDYRGGGWTGDFGY